MMCGGDTEGGGACAECMEGADIIEVDEGMEDPGEEDGMGVLWGNI